MITRARTTSPSPPAPRRRRHHLAAITACNRCMSSRSGCAVTVLATLADPSVPSDETGSREIQRDSVLRRQCIRPHRGSNRCAISLQTASSRSSHLRRQRRHTEGILAGGRRGNNHGDRNRNAHTAADRQPRGPERRSNRHMIGNDSGIVAGNWWSDRHGGSFTLIPCGGGCIQHADSLDPRRGQGRLHGGIGPQHAAGVGEGNIVSGPGRGDR